jgi:molybdopterin/thiamine biosynthesis adenylyltransferase
VSAELQAALCRVAETTLAAVSSLDTARLPEGFCAGLTGTMTVDGHGLEVAVRIPDAFPRSLPAVFVVGGLPFPIPHIEKSGRVCSAVEQGLVIDRRNPAGVIAWALEAARRTISDGLNRRNSQDFIEEFGSYWLRSDERHWAYSAVNPNDRQRQVMVLERGNAQTGGLMPVAFFDDRAGRQVIEARLKAKDLAPRFGVYIPLTPRGSFIPPQGGQTWTFGEWRELIKASLLRADRRNLKRLLKKSGADAPVVVGLAKHGGGRTLVAFKPRAHDKTHPLADQSEQTPVPIQLERWDKEYLLPRGGASNALLGKKVAIVGCGAVGGHIAEMLAASGVGHLTLVDPDTMSNDNTFRHFLGKTLVGERKASALEIDIRWRFPYIDMQSFNDDIMALIQANTLSFAAFDLIILATGEPTLELELNERLRRLPKAPPAIHTWVEPLGIGGHAVLTVRAKQGCLECLFTSPDDEDAPMYNQASFAGPNQEFTRDLAGCGGAFTPFSYLDGLRTAETAARLAIGSLRGAIQESRLTSWRGESAEFLRAGFQLSPRWSVTDDKLTVTGEVFRQSDCPVCAARLD